MENVHLLASSGDWETVDYLGSVLREELLQARFGKSKAMFTGPGVGEDSANQ